MDDARLVIEQTPRDHDAPWAFLTLRGHHYTPSTRSHHWNRMRSGAQLGEVRLHDATRHYFAWYGLNVLTLPPHVLAEQLGHKDSGKLIVDSYGHPDAAVARKRIRDAYGDRGNVVQMPSKRKAVRVTAHQPHTKPQNHKTPRVQGVLPITPIAGTTDG